MKRVYRMPCFLGLEKSSSYVQCSLHILKSNFHDLFCLLQLERKEAIAGILLGVYTILQKFSCWFFGAQKRTSVSSCKKYICSLAVKFAIYAGRKKTCLVEKNIFHLKEMRRGNQSWGCLFGLSNASEVFGVLHLIPNSF